MLWGLLGPVHYRQVRGSQEGHCRYKGPTSKLNSGLDGGLGLVFLGAGGKGSTRKVFSDGGLCILKSG